MCRGWGPRSEHGYGGGAPSGPGALAYRRRGHAGAVSKLADLGLPVLAVPVVGGAGGPGERARFRSRKKRRATRRQFEGSGCTRARRRPRSRVSRSSRRALRAAELWRQAAGGAGLHGVSNGATGWDPHPWPRQSPNAQVLAVEDGRPRLHYQGIFGHPVAGAYAPHSTTRCSS